MQWTVKIWWQWIRLGSRGLSLQNLAVLNVLSQVCDLGPSVGLGAPIWSLHASFIGLSEAIFQNWLHLRTCGGAHSPGVVNERGGSRGLCRSGGGWGCAGSPRGRGAPAGPPPPAPRSWPFRLAGCDPEAFPHFRNDVSSSPYSGLSKDAAKDFFFFLFSLPRAA